MSIDDKKVATLCEDLEKEPLFHMSLHSMELFHSDFIAWLANNFPEQASAVFRPWTVPMAGSHQEGRSMRESNHLDLVLQLPGLAPIAVENKVFSVPDEEQLDHYAEGALARRESGRSTYTCILFSLMSPGWVTYKRWRWLSYHELAEALQSQVAYIRAADTFAGDLIEHYIVLINLLVELFDLLGIPSPDEPLLLNPKVMDCLERVRVSAGVQKARTSWIKRELRRAVKEKGWTDIYVDDNFTRGRSLLEAFCHQGANGNDALEDKIGWQIQNGQFRLAVITSRLPRKEREAHVARRYLDWFDFTPLEVITGAKVTLSASGRKEFQGYDPNFVYRYYSAPQLTPSQIVELGLLYLDRARQVFMKNHGSSVSLTYDKRNRDFEV